MELATPPAPAPSPCSNATFWAGGTVDGFAAASVADRTLSCHRRRTNEGKIPRGGAVRLPLGRDSSSSTTSSHPVVQLSQGISTDHDVIKFFSRQLRGCLSYQPEWPGKWWAVNWDGLGLKQGFLPSAGSCIWAASTTSLVNTHQGIQCSCKLSVCLDTVLKEDDCL